MINTCANITGQCTTDGARLALHCEEPIKILELNCQGLDVKKTLAEEVYVDLLQNCKFKMF